MIKKIKFVCFAFIAFFSAITFACSDQAPQVLEIAFNDTVSKPWKWKENGNYVGPFLDVMQEVANRSGIKITLNPLPWKRVLAEMKAGVMDGFIGGYKTPEREIFADFLDTPICWTTISVFVRKGNEFPFHSIDYLYGKKIGIVRGYSTSNEFDIAWKNGKITVIELGSYESLVKMLDADRLDGIAGATSTIQAHFINMKRMNRFVNLPHLIIGPKPIYICLSKNSKILNRQDLIAKMNKAIRDMEKDQSFEKISQKYGYDKCIVFGCP
ncbi:MAG: transporter substrate-binding domain-containing protein [Proteobacteria bacterium]|nr:transporter substrate-binding domain-containing protein [Pseudomonadota bacterium]